MQTIILAAGMGKRLGEYTKNNTKYMVPVNDKQYMRIAVRNHEEFEETSRRVTEFISL